MLTSLSGKTSEMILNQKFAKTICLKSELLLTLSTLGIRVMILEFIPAKTQFWIKNWEIAAHT